MDSRPKIFISTVSSEFASAREKIADVLRILHFDPVQQKEFPNHTGTVRDMLEEKLKPCAAVIQIVGQRYGWDVYGAPDPTQVMSYTHYEADYAHRHKLPIWYLIADDSYKPDRDLEEGAEKRALQAAYQIKIRRTGYLYHGVSDLKDVEIAVFRMFEALDELRAPSFRCFTLWNGQSPEPPSATPELLNKQPAVTPAELEKMMRGLFNEMVPALQKVRQGVPEEEEKRNEDDLYARLAATLEISPEKARAEIEGLASKIKEDSSESLLERAKAAYALRNYEDAEALAIRAAEHAAAASPPDIYTQIEAWFQAADAAEELLNYRQGLIYYKKADSLVSQHDNPLGWCVVQHRMAYLLAEFKNTAEAEKILRDVVEIRTSILGPDHFDTLDSRSNLAGTLCEQRKFQEAEQIHKEVLTIRTRTLGEDHPITLTCRSNLANTLGPQGRAREEKEEHKAILEKRRLILGEHHSDTLSSRNNLAAALHEERDFSGSAQEHRAVLSLREQIHGDEHPQTLMSCFNLAISLRSLGEIKDALALALRALKGREKIFGKVHSTVKQSQQLVTLLETQLANPKPQ